MFPFASSIQQKYYEVIEVFKGENTIIIPLHNRDVNDGDKIYNTPTQKI
jgi:hypothetical protein